MLERIHLTIIDEVARTGSLTAAARKLFLTQSALSHSIKKLETYLGVDVWARDGRRIQLTNAGRYLLAVAQRVLPQIAQAETTLKQFANGELGTLRIGMECHPCYEWLLQIVPGFLTAWPGVDIDVMQEFKFGGVEALASYEIDLLITPDPILKENLVYLPVFDFEQVLVVSSKNKLANKANAEPNDLTDQILITYPLSIDRLDVYSYFLRPSGVVPQKHKSIEATEIIMKMVESERGVTAMPDWLANRYRQSHRVTTLRMGEQGIQKKIYLGVRAPDVDIDYISFFVAQAKNVGF